MLYKSSNKVVDFRLTPGVYTDWSGDSATGKTYTKILLDALIASGETGVLTCTYADLKFAGEEAVINKIESGSYDVIFIDRANLYMSDRLYAVLKQSGAIVYLDIKSNVKGLKYCGSECYMNFTEEGIVYYADTV